MLANMATLG